MAEDRVLTENECDGKERKVGGQNLEKESHRKRRRELIIARRIKARRIKARWPIRTLIDKLPVTTASLYLSTPSALHL